MVVRHVSCLIYFRRLPAIVTFRLAAGIILQALQPVVTAGTTGWGLQGAGRRRLATKLTARGPLHVRRHRPFRRDGATVEQSVSDRLVARSSDRRCLQPPPNRCIAKRWPIDDLDLYASPAVAVPDVGAVGRGLHGCRYARLKLADPASLTLGTGCGPMKLGKRQSRICTPNNGRNYYTAKSVEVRISFE